MTKRVSRLREERIEIKRSIQFGWQEVPDEKWQLSHIERDYAEGKLVEGSKEQFLRPAQSPMQQLEDNDSEKVKQFSNGPGAVPNRILNRWRSR
jgi:hypothetical protein